MKELTQKMHKRNCSNEIRIKGEDSLYYFDTFLTKKIPFENCSSNTEHILN